MSLFFLDFRVVFITSFHFLKNNCCSFLQAMKHFISNIYKYIEKIDVSKTIDINRRKLIRINIKKIQNLVDIYGKKSDHFIFVTEKPCFLHLWVRRKYHRRYNQIRFYCYGPLLLENHTGHVNLHILRLDKIARPQVSIYKRVTGLIPALCIEPTSFLIVMAV